MRLPALLLAALLALPAATMGEAARAQGALGFWFDPTQLPSFTGTVERYLLNPRGETDALLLREGAQVSFPPEFGAAMREAVAPGRPIVVWGIRARNAPVITALAYAPDAEAAPVLVERFYWRSPGGEPDAQAGSLAVRGRVKAPYYAPQGQVTGAVLEDGTVVVVPPAAVASLGELLRPGAQLAAEGRGVAGEAGRALAAQRIGESAASLRPLPAAAASAD